MTFTQKIILTYKYDCTVLQNPINVVRQEGATELWGAMDLIDRSPDSHEVVDGFCRETLMRFEGWTNDLVKFIATLPQSDPVAREHMHKIEKMGLARVEITREINLHPGAALQAAGTGLIS
jgi:hypothetical protein